MPVEFIIDPAGLLLLIGDDVNNETVTFTWKMARARMMNHIGE